ncbi:RNA-binding S4 domain-containing protein [Jonesia quinghaiensis]|uniref:RNA-binding S4 domain-containing protein n=1 Tax=Jonesia quinghaiensis TaxID=262806 RepID=UPI0004291D1C|nr:RNA-binding S4 domain-containing protein [Jonesia quinghaiensis]
MTAAPGPAHARVDVWVWATRLAKTRSLAAKAARAGHITINGERAKPATAVSAGDRLTVRIGEVRREVEVKAIITKRVGAPIAVTCYIDHTPPPVRDSTPPMPRRDRGAGRPTKRERRQLDSFLGRDLDDPRH